MLVKSKLTGQQYIFPDDMDQGQIAQAIRQAEADQEVPDHSPMGRRVPLREYLQGLGESAQAFGRQATSAMLGLPGEIESLVRLQNPLQAGRFASGQPLESTLPQTDDIRPFVDKIADDLVGEQTSKVIGEGGREAFEFMGDVMAPLGIQPTKQAIDLARKAPVGLLNMMAEAPQGLSAQRGMFVGPRSKLFNQEAADLANEMKAQGATRAEIWEATGNQYGTPMIHGYDGQLRQEITDEGAELSTDTQGLIDLVAQEGGEIPVSKAMYHDDFFQAYDPDSIANRASFQAVTDEDFLGSYTPSKNLLEARMSKGGELTPEDQLSSTMLHEIQHLAQRVEGFGTGGNDDIMALLPQAIDKRRNSLVEQINKLPDIEVNQKASTLSQLSEAVDKKFPSTPSQQGIYHNQLKATVMQLQGSGLISPSDHDEMMAMLDSDAFMDQRNGFKLRQRFNEYLKSKVPEIEQLVGFSLPVGDSANKYRSIQSKIVDSLGQDEKYAYNRKSELKNDLYQLNEALQTINNRYDSGSNTYKMYLDIFGEQEARLTQDRQSMSMLDRIGQPPEYNDLGINISKDGEVRLVSGATKPSMDNSVVLGDLSEFIKSNNRGLLDEIDTSYRGSHTAPYRDDEGYNPSLDDVSSMYGDDIYTGNALRYFGEGRDYDKKAIDIIQKMRGNPDAEITIYRALPIGQNEINPRDWVTTTREYALEHIGDDEGYHIVSKKVKASDVFTEGNSIHEFGYDPLDK